MADTLRVLLVDDSLSALSQTAALLASCEAVEVVGTARDGLTGVTLAAQKKPDLVLMDIVMPILDGISALRMIQSKNPEVRVAMVSSVAGIANRAQEAFRVGAIQVLGKPLDSTQLESLLESEWEHKRDRDARRRAARRRKLAEQSRS